MSEKYRFKVLFELVDDGLIQSDIVAKYMNITEAAFKEKMANFAY